MVYRFRITYEDHEEIFRDIDIKASQNFYDFHTIIQQAISFDNSKPASFYTCDDYWRKEEEIPVIRAQPKRIAKDEVQRRPAVSEYVNDPHQKFLYVFDPEKEWTFQVELMKIIQEDNTVSYPVCVKTSGVAPKQYKEVNIPPPPAEDEEDEPPKVKDTKEALMDEISENISDKADDDPVPLDDEDLKTGEEEDDEIPEDEEGEAGYGLEEDEEY